jgi:hypothetical protein
MATQQEIIDSIEAGMRRVEATFGTLSDDQLQRKVHEGEDGWTAKEILAHLAGRKAGYDRILVNAGGGEAATTGAINVDDWNRQSVNQRIGNSRDALLAEFRDVHQDLIDRVLGLEDEQLSETIDLPRGTMAVGDVLMRSGGQHSINHTAEVEQALGLAAPEA